MAMSPADPIHPQIISLIPVIRTAWPPRRELAAQLTSPTFQEKNKALRYSPFALCYRRLLCDHYPKMRCIPFPSLQKYTRVPISEPFLSIVTSYKPLFMRHHILRGFHIALIGGRYDIVYRSVTEMIR